MTQIEMLPPHDSEAEDAVLGSMLIDDDAWLDVGDILPAEAFYREPNRLIYRAMLDLKEQRDPIDFVTLTGLLRSREQLEDVGGEQRLISLLNAVPTSVNAKAYARMVLNAHRRRKMIAGAQTMVRLAYDESLDVEAAMEQAEHAFFKAIDSRRGDGPQHIRDVARQRLDEIERLHEEGEGTVGIDTGYKDLTKMLGGWQDSGFYLVAGRPGMGKTSLLMGSALWAAGEEGKRVAVFGLEMTAGQMVDRKIAMESRIDSQRLMRGQIYENEWPMFLETVGRLAEMNIWYDDTPALTPVQLRTKARKLHVEHGLDLVMVDYLQLMNAAIRANTTNEAVSHISRSLKQLARELSVPVVVASQLSRAVENRADKRPQLSDLRDSGSLEQDADVVMFIYRDEYYNPDTTDSPSIAEILIRKHRNGPTGRVDLYWHGKLATLRDLQRQEINLNGPSGTTSAVESAGRWE